ncbi:anhydro-N-acetylmuramic acid kinase [Lacisediminihabitans sp.]|uniref:anhydro-N-acetylmuramic acid kinase n=1 Tax=Lacisediminihabitans sp. TaxID=2787631 RepID=UPI00374DBDA3
MRILSLQSGTSADGIDVAVVDIEQADGSQTPALRLTTVLTTSVDWDEHLRHRILAAAGGAAIGAQELCELDALTGQAFAAAAEAAIRETTAVDLVVSHGQTLHHWVDAGGARGTLQTGEASWIAEACCAPVLSNLRAADIAAGGDGAPLMGIFDRAWLGESVRAGRPVATLNLGGIANLSVLDAERPDLAWDTGPGNALIDAVVARATGGAVGYDDGGRIGAAGRVDEGALRALLEHPYLGLAAPKSTGRETFGLPVVDRAAEGLELADLVATLVRFTARSIADGLRANASTLPSRLIASGGGVHNPALMGDFGRAGPAARGARDVRRLRRRPGLQGVAPLRPARLPHLARRAVRASGDRDRRCAPRRAADLWAASGHPAEAAPRHPGPHRLGEPRGARRGRPMTAGLADEGNGVELSHRSILRAIAGLGRTDFDNIGIGAAGVAAAPAATHELIALLRADFGVPVAVLTDALAAHAGAFAGGPGTVLIAGTGAVVFAIDAAGTISQVDGAGTWLGDEGGGSWIGQAGLRAVMRAADGRGPRTALSGDAAALVGDIATLPRWVSATGAPARTLGSFAPTVIARAALGDEVALGIVDEASRLLALACAAPRGTTTVCITGGLSSQPFFRSRLEAALESEGLGTVPPLGDALAGAALIAVDESLPLEMRVTRG